ncbi:hypothetical protein [Kitasatospora sp. MBT63]|uniref:hypothetical protein n=1 Tax=Kitasatospora sp. MBT63 TaxID=1444768 RepID=UPI00053AE531|nr:hypothetical protein [Kitasatospora sp. MBT63]
MFRRWWFLGLLRPAEQGPRPPGRRESKEAGELVLREWQVLRDRLSAIAAERVAAAGDLFRAAELRLPPGETAARRDYLWALEAYEAAGRLLDEAAGLPDGTDLPDLTAAVVLAEQAVERLAAAHTVHAGGRPRPFAVRCFYNPLHGPAAVPAAGGGKAVSRKSRRRPTVGAREAAADRRPACTSCRNAILAGQSPDVLPALLPAARTGRRGGPPVLVPYYAVPQQWSPWSATACGAYDEGTPALVLRGGHRRPRT